VCVFVVGLVTSITLAEVVLALLAGRLVYRVATGRARVNGWPLAVPFAAWTVASLATASLSAHPAESLVVVAKGVGLFAVFYVILDDTSADGAADRLMSWLLALVGLIGAVAIVQVALCPTLAPLARLSVLARVATKCDRAHAFYSIYMTLAGVLNVVLLATIARLLLDTAVRKRFCRVAAAGIAGIGLVLTYVRGAWLGFLAGVVLLLPLIRQSRHWPIVVVAVLAAAILFLPGARMRAASIVDGKDPTARERVAMWASALGMIRDHPLSGVGPGQLKYQYPRYAAQEYRERPRGHLHNTPLQILAERGVPGFLAWSSIFIAFFWRGARILRCERTGVHRALVVGSLAGVVGFLVAGLTEYNFGDSEVVLVVYTVMAVPFAVAGSAAGADDRPLTQRSPES
jgi:O-antigen ligase